MTIRGQFDGKGSGAPSVRWRADGAGDRAEAPLLLALHGMGMDENFLADLLRGLFPLRARFLIPRAFHPVTMGDPPRAGYSWYHYDGDQEDFRRELERMEASMLSFLHGVEAEQGWRPRTRILFGFSQGGYGGAYFALRHPELFDGLIISGARVKWEILGAEIQAAGRRGMRALLLHGEGDRAVSPDAATGSRDALAGGGVSVELRTFDGGHIVGRSQIAAIGEWLGKHFIQPLPSGP